MSGRGTRAAAASDFTELWRNVSKVCHSKTRDTKPGQQTPATTASAACNDFQSPKRRGCSRYLHHGDSPGEVEPSQDIFWDSTSPTQANAGLGLRNNRVVEISDIVNRIAPKDVKGKGTDSPLLQWIGDSAVPCTPEIPKPRLRKKSSRQSSVEDLMKLAKQFDENMQQDMESSEQLSTANNKLTECVNTSQRGVKDPQCPSSSDQVEAELHALFDCSTQKVSGQLSQGLSASVCSQEIKGLPEPQQHKLMSTDKSSLATNPAEKRRPQGCSANSCDDFDDDWDNDDLLNDSFILAITQNPDQQLNPKHKTNFQANTNANTIQFTSIYKSTGNTNSTHHTSGVDSNSSCSALQELCPKTKTTNRSTFKLEPNPYFQQKSASREVSKSSSTGLQPKKQMFDKKTATTKTLSTPQTADIVNDQRGAFVAADSLKDISDSLWDDGEDDALLYQVCDSVERISNSQPQQEIPSNCQQKQDITVERQQKTTAPLPINLTWTVKAGASTNRQSSHAFVRSNSLPSTNCGLVNYQGWNVPMIGANTKSWMSQSLPGSHMRLGTAGQCEESPGSFQDSSGNVDMKPRTVTAMPTHTSRSHHSAFKRNVSDSAAICNKVFVTNEMTGKCSAAEIERKKQEALARRRLRMQTASKP